MGIKHTFGKLLQLLTAMAVISATPLYGQQPVVSSYADLALIPEAVSAGSKLPPRSYITPYPSREEALVGASDSPYVIPLTQWSRETVPGGTKYTTQFKKHYSWDNRAVLLRIEDATASFQVEINDSLAGYSQAGMGRSEFDLSDWTRPDYNTICVTLFDNYAAKKIENGREATTPDFRHASIVSQPTVRIHDLFATTTTDDKYGYIALDIVTQSNLLNPKEYTLHYELINPQGQTVALSQKGVQTSMLSRDTARFVVRINNPVKWNHETPNLYTLLVRSQHEGRFQENIAVKIGFRTTGYENGSLTIDGSPAPLCTIRYTANDNATLTAEKLTRLKESGYNCIVVESHPQPDYLYTLCDEIGLYVCDATDIDTSNQPKKITVGGNPGNDPAWKDAYVDRALTTYYSAHLHPSVVMISPARSSANGYSLYESYLALKQADPKMLLFCADADGQWNNDIVAVTLFREPQAKGTTRGNSPVSASLVSTETGATVILSNNQLLTAVKGTYKITIKEGRKTRFSYQSEFSIDPNSSIEIPFSGYTGGLKSGNVHIEVHTLKSTATPTDTAQKRTIADLYNTLKESFPL